MRLGGGSGAPKSRATENYFLISKSIISDRLWLGFVVDGFARRWYVMADVKDSPRHQKRARLSELARQDLEQFADAARRRRRFVPSTLSDVGFWTVYGILVVLALRAVCAGR